MASSAEPPSPTRTAWITFTGPPFRGWPFQAPLLESDRLAEVETLLSDPTKAKKKSGWFTEISVEEMCAEMVASDLEKASRQAFLTRHGHLTHGAKE